MKAKLIIGILTAVLFNALTSQVFAGALDVSHGTMFGIQMGLSLIPLQASGCLLDGLNKEIWLPGIVEQFFPSDSFVNESRNLDA